jgi:hypothetical protein
MNGLTPAMQRSMQDAIAFARDLFRVRHQRFAGEVFTSFAASLFTDVLARSSIHAQDALIATVNRALTEAGSAWRISERVEP